MVYLVQEIWFTLFGLDKAKLEIYALVASIYYHIPIDFTTQLWEEFVKSISNTNVVNGISCARY